MNTRFNQRRSKVLSFMLSLGMLAGVLIWAKLRLVTDIPRSALAEPEEVIGNGSEHPDDEESQRPIDETIDDSDDLSPSLSERDAEHKD